MVEGRQSIRPGLRRQVGTIRNEAEMIDVYQKDISKKYTNKLVELKERLQGLGLLYHSMATRKCILSRVVAHLVAHELEVT